MKLPLHITFRGIHSTPALDAYVRTRAERLDTFCDAIMGCRVLVEISERHHRKGERFHVRVDVTVPGDELVVRRAPAESAAHEDAHAVIDAAFDDAQRLLEDYVRRRRGDVKLHESQAMRGRVRLLSPGEGFGFLEAYGGEDVYFHRNAVSDEGFDRLRVGDVVRYAAEAGAKGPQATFVERTSRTSVPPSPPPPRA